MEVESTDFGSSVVVEALGFGSLAVARTVVTEILVVLMSKLGSAVTQTVKLGNEAAQTPVVESMSHGDGVASRGSDK